MDDLLLVFTNGGQSVTLETLKVAIERITKQDLSENIFRSVLSVNPDDNSLTMLKSIQGEMENRNEKVSSSTNENRLGYRKDNLENF